MDQTIPVGVEATLEQAVQLGLLPKEFEKIKNILRRTPNFTELSVFSVMWSEHCSYKNSILWLKTLPREGAKMLAKAGEENAGLIDIGNGLACCFKIESHNHPSAIEPYQGAATGVGGINRDIFSMGARPVAQLNSLRFGNIADDRTKWLVRGVVKGIGDYGNAFGVPTVGGEAYFDDCYQINPLVNAMSIGIAQVGKTVSAVAHGPGNPVYIFGSATGKDGIHGAAFASKDITEDSAKDLPSVQVGDPFWEKLILEATMELIENGVVVGMQDMGAAGITCSTSEMSAKSKTGMDIWLDKVPLRQADMKDWEILLSESQERMLVVIKKGFEPIAEAVFKKWDLTYACIGIVTDTGKVNYFMNGELRASIPAESLVLGGGAPVYERDYSEPAYFKEIENFDINEVEDFSIDETVQVAEFMCGLPNIASKKWIYRQYDSMVGTVNRSTNNPGDAAVIKIKQTGQSIAATVDCNSRYVFANPYVGGMIAVAEAARNLVCTGAEPAAITNCLNFGNPYNKEVYYQFVHAIKGMGEACRKFDTPVTGGNVSFYNQSSDNDAVFPTPTIGMVGIVPEGVEPMSLNFKTPGDFIIVLGPCSNDLASSQYLVHYKKISYSPAPYFNLDDEYNTQQTVLELIKKQLIKSAHDISEGGLFIAMLESAMPNNLGFNIRHADCNLRNDAFLFGEAQGRIIISAEPAMVNQIENILQNHKVHYKKMGFVTDGNIMVNGVDMGSTEKYKKIYESALENYLN